MSKRLIGTKPNQVPTNGMLGTAAYADSRTFGFHKYAELSITDWANEGPDITTLYNDTSYLSRNSGGDNFHIPIDTSYKVSKIFVTRRIYDFVNNHNEYIALHYESGSQITGNIEGAIQYFRANQTSGTAISGTAVTWATIGNNIDDGYIMTSEITVFNGDAGQNGFHRPKVHIQNTYTYASIGVTHAWGSLSVNTNSATIGAVQFNVDGIGGANTGYDLVDYVVFGVR
jgi:hypothetical protein